MMFTGWAYYMKDTDRPKPHGNRGCYVRRGAADHFEPADGYSSGGKAADLTRLSFPSRRRWKRSRQLSEKLVKDSADYAEIYVYEPHLTPDGQRAGS
jgi:hypothetical protein